MNYTTHKVAQKLGITKDTLFYYEKVELLPQIERDEMNRRIYSESDIEWIFFNPLFTGYRYADVQNKTIYFSP